MRLQQGKNQNKFILLSELCQEFDLEILTSFSIEDIKITRKNIYRSIYEIMGIFENKTSSLTDSIHVAGNKEADYIWSLDSEQVKKTFSKYFSYSFPCLIVCKNYEIRPEVLEIAEQNKKPILKSKLEFVELTKELKSYLLFELAEEKLLTKYAFLEIRGVGVLIAGSPAARYGIIIELIERGHKFITEKLVLVRKEGERELVGYNRMKINHIESDYFIADENGKNIDITTIFGMKSTRESKRINMLINLEAWDDDKFYDRLGLDVAMTNILGVDIPTYDFPIKKGRNLAVIIEVAAMNLRLLHYGINSAQVFAGEAKKLIMKNKEKNIKGGKMGRKALPVKEFIAHYNLKVIYGEEFVEENFIGITNVFRPILGLAGFYEKEESGCLQIFSNQEFEFLDTLVLETREKNIENYLNHNYPLFIITKNTEIPDYFMEKIKERKTVVVEGNYEDVSESVEKYSVYLNEYYSPTTTVHGVFLELYGHGVLITGKSGIGKSETALELVHRGHRLVADDIVKFSKRSNGDIFGCAANLPYFMEIRGLGVIDIKSLYGLGAVRINKRLDVIVELIDSSDDKNYSGLLYCEHSEEEILGEKIQKSSLAITSGRNAAAMVEIAVMNMASKKLGYDAEKLYNKGISILTAEEKKLLGSEEDEDEIK